MFASMLHRYIKFHFSGSKLVLLQILPDMIKRSSVLFHNAKTAVPSYMGLEAFCTANSNDSVKDISSYTHELRWVKSHSEIQLMRQSASIACQVYIFPVFRFNNLWFAWYKVHLGSYLEMI